MLNKSKSTGSKSSRAEIKEVSGSMVALLKSGVHRAGKWLRKNLGFLGFFKKNLKIFKSPNFRFSRFYYFCPFFS